MRKLLAICVGLVVFLGTTSGILWRDLQAARQLVSELQTQMTQARVSDQGSARPPPPQIASEETTTPVAPAKIPDPMPVTPLPPSPMGPSASMRLAELDRAETLRQADETATGKVLQWKDKLLLDGHTLTTEQLQALNAASIRETRRDAEESLAQRNPTEPIMDQEASFRSREENLIRANELNLRILQSVRSQLTAEQAQAIQSMFEAGHKTRMANLNAERERYRLRAE